MILKYFYENDLSLLVISFKYDKFNQKQRITIFS